MEYDRFPNKVEKNGRTYYLLLVPPDGLNKEKAEQYGEGLKSKHGFNDYFLEESDGFYYIYGDPGITLKEIVKLISRFDWVEEYGPIMEAIQWATIHHIPSEEIRSTVFCKRCNYAWETKSQMSLVTCPNCGFKTPREVPDSHIIDFNKDVPWPWENDEEGGDKDRKTKPK